MSTEKWIAGSGQGLTWGSAFGTEINSMASANSVLSSVSITNGTALDIFADFSVTAGGTITSAAPNYFGLYLMPLNQDGTVYGDGINTTTPAAYVPPATYWVGNIMVRAAASTIVQGTLPRIILPPGTFSFVAYNGCGATFHATMTCKYRTYNRSII